MPTNLLYDIFELVLQKEKPIWELQKRVLSTSSMEAMETYFGYTVNDPIYKYGLTLFQVEGGLYRTVIVRHSYDSSFTRVFGKPKAKKKIRKLGVCIGCKGSTSDPRTARCKPCDLEFRRSK